MQLSSDGSGRPSAIPAGAFELNQQPEERTITEWSLSVSIASLSQVRALSITGELHSQI
jgi:hypothetical protein